MREYTTIHTYVFELHVNIDAKGPVLPEERQYFWPLGQFNDRNLVARVKGAEKIVGSIESPGVVAPEDKPEKSGVVASEDKPESPLFYLAQGRIRASSYSRALEILVDNIQPAHLDYMSIARAAKHGKELVKKEEYEWHWDERGGAVKFMDYQLKSNPKVVSRRMQGIFNQYMAICEAHGQLGFDGDAFEKNRKPRARAKDR